jgi:hypothetical protein
VGTVNPVHPLYFDHTSILKTIARRFMPVNPPYLTPRSADANDLSSVLSAQPHTPQFLPFLRYNLTYGQSKKRLDVRGGATTVGTIVQQFDVKYPTTGLPTTTTDPQKQHWYRAKSPLASQPDTYTISNAAFPAWCSSQPATAAIREFRWPRRAAKHIGTAVTLTNPWQVTSPSLPASPECGARLSRVARLSKHQTGGAAAAKGKRT